MARKGRRAPPKRASAAPADPLPAPDSDAHISATAPLEDVATSPGEIRDPTLSTDTVLADADPVGAEKTPVSSETAEPSPAKDPLLPSEEAAPASAPVKATPSSLEPPSPWDAAPSELLSFPAGFSLPPIPSTSTAMAGPSAPEARSYTPAEFKAWRDQQIDAKQAEVCWNGFGPSRANFRWLTAALDPAAERGRRQARRLCARAVPSRPLCDAHRLRSRRR